MPGVQVYIVSMFFIMMNVFLAILGEAYSVVRQVADEEAKLKIKVKSRGIIGWLRLSWKIFQAKRARARKKREQELMVDDGRNVPPPPSAGPGNGKPPPKSDTRTPAA